MSTKLKQNDSNIGSPVTTINDDVNSDDYESPNEGEVLSKLVEIARFSSLFRFPSDEVIQQLSILEIFPKCIVFDLDDTVWCGDVDCTNGPPFAPYHSTTGFRKTAHSNGGKKSETNYPDESHSAVVTCQGIDGIYDRCDIERMMTNSKKSKHRDPNKQSQIPPVRPSLSLFPDVLSIFTWLESKQGDVHIAVASRTTEPRWADKALSVLKTTSGSTFSELVSCSECYNTCKKNHLSAICRKLKVNLSEVVFYDNLYYNLSDVESMPIVNPATRQVNKKITAVTMYTPRGLDWSNFVEGLIKYQAARQNAQY